MSTGVILMDKMKLDPTKKIDFWERAVRNATERVEQEMQKGYSLPYTITCDMFSKRQYKVIIELAKIMVRETLLDEAVHKELTDPTFPPVVYAAAADDGEV